MIKEEEKQKKLGEDILNDIDVLIDVQPNFNIYRYLRIFQKLLNNLKKKFVLYFQNQNKGEKNELNTSIKTGKK